MRTVRVLTCSVALALVVAPAAADGKALYGSKCAACHGQDGVPKKLGAGSKAFGDPEFKAAATVDAIVASIRDGKDKMKPVKNLSDADAKLIAEYVLTITPAK
jgi:mono/diheme cytochrome c family protein